jgi:hypothetical protein
MSDLPIVSQTIVIGAGPAGLAVGACLKQANIPCLILEQSDQVGSVWHRHYDRLHLHTDKKNSQLPYFPYPLTYPRYPSRTQVIKYLESYAEKFHLDIRFRQQVISARYEDELWAVHTREHLYQAQNLVIANITANLPTCLVGPESFRSSSHSSEYRNGELLRQKAWWSAWNWVRSPSISGNTASKSVCRYEQGECDSRAVRLPILTITILQSQMRPAADAPMPFCVWIGDLTQWAA